MVQYFIYEAVNNRHGEGSITPAVRASETAKR